MFGEGGKNPRKRPGLQDDDITKQHSPNKISNASGAARTFTFETRNPFEPLTNLMDSDSLGDSNQSAAHTSLVPPIFVSLEKQNFSSICKIISKASMTKSFTTKLIHKQVKVMLTDVEEYRNVTKALLSANIEFHSFRNPSNKILSIVLKDMPTSITDEEIFNELKTMDYPVIKAARLFNQKTKSPMPVVAIELEDNDKSQEILNLKTLFYSIIKVEIRHKPKHITQCTRCQRKGHTKNYCHLTPRCVKCTEQPPHATKDCKKKDKVKPAKCVNCDGEHPANYRGCTYLKKPINRTSQKSTHPTSTEKIPPASQPEPFMTQQTSSRSKSTFASILKSRSRPANEMSSIPTSFENSETNVAGGQNDSLINILSSLVKVFLPQIKLIIKSIITEVLSLNNDD